MSLEPEFQLKHTNVSQPRLSHQGSKQSIVASLAASEGYYSLSENASSESGERKPLFQTPPSHQRTPAESHEHLLPSTETPITSLRGVGIPRQNPQPPQPAYIHERPQSPSVSTIAEERPGTQGTRRSQVRSDMDSDSLATTPGQDTTPYIRFAIDQLTRDEEVRGSRIYPEVRSPVYEEDEEDYPVERIISDDGLGYMAQEQRTQQRMSQYIPPKPQRQPSTRNANAQIPITTQPHYPRNQVQRPPSPRGQKDVFVASSQPHAPLHFLPAILRPLWLGLFIFLCLLMLAGLIFSAIYSNRNGGNGLWDYNTFGGGRYFVFEYLPTMLGMFILLWLIQVQTALQRVMPFVSMASESFHRRSEAVFLQLYPMQFLLPNIEHFRAGHRRVGVSYIIFWLFTWTIPLLASSFNVRYDLERGVWRWVAVQGVIWAIVALYILLVIALVTVLIFLIQNRTGLKWDPRSLADIISLMERSNIMADYNGSETFEKGDWHLVSNRADRIGYWSTTKRPNDFYYGIGEEGGEIRRFSVEDGRIREKGPERTYPEPTPGNERTSDFSIRMDIRSPGVRLRYLPWYLKDGSVIAWIVIACVLLIAFLVVSFVNSAVRLGFLPQVFARTDAGGFSASNFLYSFIPALIGNFLFLAMLSLDYSLRTLQPYISLSSKGGATAETSLLVDYACRLPFSATLSAIENKHYQTAVLSLGSLTSISLPVLAGGCFWTQYYNNEDTVRVSAELPGYYALCFFLALYTVSLIALFPGRRRAALPHRSNTLAEIISWIYQSPILTDRAFARPQTKPELVARLMGSTYLERTWTRSVASLVRPSRNNLRADSPTDPALTEKKTRKERRHEKHDSLTDPGKIRYGFGIHVGRDGLEHLGIDRVRRGGDRSGRELVIWEEQRNNKRKSWTEHV
ncbi:Nn.00g037370.m01.CDS01 [Neocucurbitaria sp. VM-36]